MLLKPDSLFNPPMATVLVPSVPSERLTSACQRARGSLALRESRSSTALPLRFIIIWPEAKLACTPPRHSTCVCVRVFACVCVSVCVCVCSADPQWYPARQALKLDPSKSYECDVCVVLIHQKTSAVSNQLSLNCNAALPHRRAAQVAREQQIN